MNADQQAALREPFPAHLIGKLPKGGRDLDFVGHGAATDRLLSVDPEWTWEPFATDEVGLPALDEFGNLWIRLTVCGVTRIGVGDGPNMKERIGDAIRNAAMRFGVALDLWIRGHGEDFTQQEQTRRPRPSSAPSSNEKVELVRKLTDLGLSTAGDVETLRQRLADAEAKVAEEEPVPPTGSSPRTKAEDPTRPFEERVDALAKKAAEKQPVDQKRKAAADA